MSELRDKGVGTLLLRGTSRRLRVLDERDGSVAGYHVEHWDDRQSGIARPKTIHVSLGRSSGGAGPRSGDRLHVPQRGLLLPGRGILRERRRPALRELLRALHRDELGVFASSGLYVDNHIDVYDATQLAIDLSLTTHKWAMYTNTLTPDFSIDVSYAATNEVTGTGYTAGGQVIVAPTTTESPAGTLMYDMNDQVWASPTTVTARGAILYADVLLGNNLIVAMTFGADITSTADTFTIQFAATGVFTIDLTP